MARRSPTEQYQLLVRRALDTLGPAFVADEDKLRAEAARWLDPDTAERVHSVEGIHPRRGRVLILLVSDAAENRDLSLLFSYAPDVVFVVCSDRKAAQLRGSLPRTISARILNPAAGLFTASSHELVPPHEALSAREIEHLQRSGRRNLPRILTSDAIAEELDAQEGEVYDTLPPSFSRGFSHEPRQVV